MAVAFNNLSPEIAIMHGLHKSAVDGEYFGIVTGESDADVRHEIVKMTARVQASEPKAQPIRYSKIGRNALCWCGSGRKFKKCHLAAS